MIAWLLTNTLTAALLAGLVYAVIRVGKPAPGVRHALWLIVLLKLVSPVEFLWSVPLAVRPAPMAEESPVSIEPLPRTTKRWAPHSNVNASTIEMVSGTRNVNVVPTPAVVASSNSPPS